MRVQAPDMPHAKAAGTASTAPTTAVAARAPAEGIGAASARPVRSVVPRHMAIVMDGNGRWARRRGQPRSFGHRAGQKAVRATVGWCLRNGVGVLTLCAWASVYGKRP